MESDDTGGLTSQAQKKTKKSCGSSKRAADPSALLRHYIAQGMLEEGCELVRNLLIGSAGLATATVGEEVDHSTFGRGSARANGG